jgi:hypothetical protein
MLEAGFKRWVKDTDTVVLVCWDLGHIWTEDLYDNIERVHGAYLMSGICQRGCGVQRTRYMTSSWSPDPSHNTYKYPRGYSPKLHMAGSPFFMSREHRAYIRREIAGRHREGKSSPGVVTPIRSKSS